MRAVVLLLLGVWVVGCSTGGAAGTASAGSSGSGGQAATGTASGGATSSTGTGSGSSGGTAGGNGSSGGSSSAGGSPIAGGCPLFAPGYAYNQDVSALQPDPDSASYIANLEANSPSIAAEFPGGEFENVVPASQPQVAVQTSAAYGFLPDSGFFDDGAAALASATAPIPADAVYENMGTANADHHFIVLQEGPCLLYELYSWNPMGTTEGWSTLVVWDLNGSPQIPDDLDTGSTTQAGTPLLPGVIWPAEVRSGQINHAIDIVLADKAIQACAYVHPASTVRWNDAAADGGLPYGARLRLKASYDTSGYTGTQALAVIRALQKYGMFNTDASGETRSVFRLGQDPDGGTLDQADISQLDQLTWSDFDVMPLGTLLTDEGCTP